MPIDNVSLNCVDPISAGRFTEKYSPDLLSVHACLHYRRLYEDVITWSSCQQNGLIDLQELCHFRGYYYYIAGGSSCEVLWWVRLCVSVCLTRGYLRKHTRDLYQFLCMLRMAMARSSCGRVTKFQGKGAVLEGFLSHWQWLYSIAVGTHTKMAEPIEMPFGISGLAPNNRSLLSAAEGVGIAHRGRSLISTIALLPLCFTISQYNFILRLYRTVQE